MEADEIGILEREDSGEKANSDHYDISIGTLAVLFFIGVIAFFFSATLVIKLMSVAFDWINKVLHLNII